mgnify:CR=1 FL=1
MAQVIVRNIEDDVKVALKKRASLHGWSMEEEVRYILRRAVNDESAVTGQLGSRIAARFADVGLAEPLPELSGQPIAPMAFGA